MTVFARSLFVLFIASLAGTVAAVAPVAAADERVAVLDGKPITLDELEQTVRGRLIEVDLARYEILEAALQELLAMRMLAAEAESRGITVEALQKAEVTDKLVEPGEEEIQQIFDANRAQLGDQTIDDVRGQIVEYLAAQQSSQLLGTLVTSLREKHELEMLLLPPSVDVGVGSGKPRHDNPDAPVVIVAFSDYECPYCKNAEQIVEEVLEIYGDKVAYYHRDYPLPFHPNAHRAAQAARCAGDQDKFWDYYTMLFVSSSLDQARLEEIAEGVQIDRKVFDECLSSGKYAPVIDTDLEDGSEVGVNGTPAFFINGRMLSGAQPVAKFQEVIDAELARADSSAKAD